jgi:hypothetical protein
MVLFQGGWDLRHVEVLVIVSGLVLLAFPLTAVVTGAAPVLRPDWPWLLGTRTTGTPRHTQAP